MFCINCGCQLPDDSKFCVICGHKIVMVNKLSYVVTAEEENENSGEIKTQVQLNASDVKTADDIKIPVQESASAGKYYEEIETPEPVNILKQEDEKDHEAENEDGAVSDEFRNEEFGYNESEQIQSDSIEEKSEPEQGKGEVSFMDMSLSDIISNVQNKFSSVFQKGLNFKAVLGVICIVLVAVLLVSAVGSSPEKLIVGTWIEQTDDYSQGEQIIFYENGSCFIDGFSASYSISGDCLTVYAYWLSETYEIDISRNKMELLEEGDFPGEETVYKREGSSFGASITEILVCGGLIALFVFMGYSLLKKQNRIKESTM